jgi:hypothetical protein
MSEELHEEISRLRQMLQEGKRTQEEFRGIVSHAALKQALTEEQIDQLTDALYPLFKSIEIDGKTIVLEIPMPYGSPDPGMMERYCTYIDFLRGMGAKNAVFVERGVKLDSLSDKQLERFGLKTIG